MNVAFQEAFKWVYKATVRQAVAPKDFIPEEKKRLCRGLHLA